MAKKRKEPLLEKVVSHTREFLIQIRGYGEESEWVSLRPRGNKPITEEMIDSEERAVRKELPETGVRVRVVVRDTTDRLYEEGADRPGPEAVKEMADALLQFAHCKLDDSNCASLDVANRRIRNTAVLALNKIFEEK